MNKYPRWIISETSGPDFSRLGSILRRVAVTAVVCLLTFPVLAGSILWGRTQEDAVLLQARTLMKEGRHEEAITKLTEYIRTNSADDRGYILLGQCYAETSQPGKAAEVLQQAVRIAPKSVDALVDLGIIEAILGKYQEAKAELQRALEIDPNNKEALIGLGKVFFKARNYSEALRYFARCAELPDSDIETLTYLVRSGAKVKALKVVEAAQEKLFQLAPRDPAAHDNLGNWLSEDGLYEAALKEFTFAMQLEPHSERIHYNLAALYLRMDQPQKAIGLLSVSPESKKEGARHHHLRGQCYEKLANSGAAYTEYQQAIELDPSEPTYFLSLASLLLSQDVPNAAYVVLTAAQKRFPSSAPVRVGMGLVQLKAGNVESALQHCQAATALDPDSETARKLLGRIQAEQGNYKEAIRTFEEAERLSPHDAQAYFFAGMAYMKLPDGSDMALESFLHSLRLDPKYASSYYWIGMIYSQRKHEYRLASKYLEEALARNPNMAAAYQILIQSYRLLGDDALAEKTASRYRAAMQRTQGQTGPMTPAAPQQ